MNSLAKLPSTMTSSLTLFLLLLLVNGFPGVVTSDGPPVAGCLSEALPQDQKEWSTSDTSPHVIQVNWNFDKVAHLRALRA